MRKAFVCAFAILLVCGVTAVSVADYYATKADYRIGRLTPGGPSPDRAGTDDCASPTAITTSPTQDTGDTSAAGSTVDAIPLACNGNYSTVAGPDHVYTFTPGTGNSLTFQISTTDADYDPSIYVLTTCDDGNSCVNGAAADNCFAVNAGGNPCSTSTELFGPTSFVAATQFFFVVDSFYAPGNPSGRDSGPYTLDVTGTFPVELIEFSVD